MSVKTVLVDGGAPVAASGGSAEFVYTLLPAGKFYDKRYGEVGISGHLLAAMEANFGKFPAYEVPVKIGHGDGALSPGKVTAVEAAPEGLKIHMQVDADTADAINRKLYRYMSAEYDEDYVDKETGAPVGPVLLGAALVNQPANPYMAPLVLADDINTRGNVEVEAIEKLQKQLSEAEAALEAAKAKEAEDQKRIEALEAEAKSLSEEKAQVAREKLSAEVKAFCDTWASKGVPPAVLERVKPVLLSEGRVVKLSDTQDAPLMAVFGDVFEAMPRMTMGQVGSSDGSGLELSDVDRAKALGKKIAESVA